MDEEAGTPNFFTFQKMCIKRLFLVVEWGLVVGAVSFASELSDSSFLYALFILLWFALQITVLVSVFEILNYTARFRSFGFLRNPKSAGDVTNLRMVFYLLLPILMGVGFFAVAMLTLELVRLGENLAN